jgi:hypothetical protein
MTVNRALQSPTTTIKRDLILPVDYPIFLVDTMSAGPDTADKTIVGMTAGMSVVDILVVAVAILGILDYAWEMSREAFHELVDQQSGNDGARAHGH